MAVRRLLALVGLVLGLVVPAPASAQSEGGGGTLVAGGAATTDASSGGRSGEGGAAEAAAEDPAPGVWRVGVAGSPPFVMVRDDELVGLSLDIWQATAQRGEIAYELVAVDDVAAAIARVAEGMLDAAVGPISVTAPSA